MSRAISHALRPSFMLLCALFLCLPLAAHSQLPLSSLKNHNSKADLELDAGNVELRDKEQLAIATGNVLITQGELTLRTERMNIRYRRNNDENPVILRADAIGAVRLTSPSETATASWGIYDVEEEQITLGGDVVLTRGADTIRGRRLVVNLKTGVTTMDGAAGAEASQPGEPGRVRARFSAPNAQGNTQP
jgi:lipopolysaccharide export system protein LptA